MRNKSSQATASGNGADPDSAIIGPDASPAPAQSGTVMDLNTAGVDQLRQLRGIGRASTQRIVACRSSHGPFASAKDITRVPGISQATYDAIAALIAASASSTNPITPEPDGPPSRAAEPAGAALTAAEAPAQSIGLVSSALPAEDGATQAPEASQSPSPAEELAATNEPAASPTLGAAEKATQSPAPPAVVTAAPATALNVTLADYPTAPPPSSASTASLPIPPAAAPAQPLPPPAFGASLPPPSQAPAPRPVATRPASPLISQNPRPVRDWTGLMAMSAPGALLGAILALLTVAGLNQGTLLLNERPEIVALTSQLDQERSRADGLQIEADSLRARPNALEGLSNRVSGLEASVAQARSALDSLQTQTSALGQRTDALESQLGVVREAVDLFDGFLSGLRALVDQAAPTPTATPTLAPRATPTLAPSATPIRLPRETLVPTSRPAPSATSAPTRTSAPNTPTGIVTVAAAPTSTVAAAHTPIQ